MNSESYIVNILLYTNLWKLNNYKNLIKRCQWKFFIVWKAYYMFNLNLNWWSSEQPWIDGKFDKHDMHGTKFQASWPVLSSLLWNFSLCGWKYMLGHFTESVEPNLWCSCNTYLNPGNCDSLNISCFKKRNAANDLIVLSPSICLLIKFILMLKNLLNQRKKSVMQIICILYYLSLWLC